MSRLSIHFIPLLLVIPMIATAAPPPARPGAEIFAERLTIDQPNLKIRGRVILHSLDPMRVEVVFEEARGEAERILGLLSRWTTLPPGVAEAVGNGPVTLTETHLHFAADGVIVTGARMDLPRGRLEGVDFQQDRRDKSWTLVLDKGRMEAIPPVQPHLPKLTNLAVERLNASGRGMTWKGTAASASADGFHAETLTSESDGEKRTGRFRAGSARLDVHTLLTAVNADTVIEKAVRDQLQQVGWRGEGASETVLVKGVDLSGPWLVQGRRPRISGGFQLKAPAGWTKVRLEQGKRVADKALPKNNG